jgi:multiple sugar transport system permease protein
MRSEDTKIGILFLLPAVTLIFGVVFYPLVYSIWLSFQRKDLFSATATFIGFDNYISLAHRPEFWQAMKNGVVFAGSTVFFQLLIGLLLALLLNLEFKGRGLARGLAFLPYVVPTVVVVMQWKWLLNDLYGIINYALEWIGVIDSPVVWLGHPNLAMFTVIVINIWEWYPFVLVALLARLATIPRALYEAAMVDGASAWDKLIYITLPQLKTIILILALLRGIWMFNKFDVIYLLTQGDPLGSTTHLPILAYEEAFASYDMGKSAAIAVTMLIILTIAAVVHIRPWNISRLQS